MLRRKGKIKTQRSFKTLLLVDMLAYTASSLSLLFTLDQARLVWFEQDASGVSPLSWLFYTISACVWFSYGLVHRDRVLIVTQSAWVVVSLIVFTGVVLR